MDEDCRTTFEPENTKARLPLSTGRSFLGLLWRQPLWAVLFAFFFGTLSGAHVASYVLSFKLSLVFSYCIGLGLWLARYVIVPRRLDPARSLDPRHRITIGLYFVGTALIMSFVAALVIHLTILPGFLGSWRSVAVTGLYTLVFTVLFAGINFAVVFYRQAVDRARAVEQIRAELAQAELRALRAQIRPHFLFNTLNSIASLIATQPAAAEDMTTRLADVFRYTLRASDREHAALADELAFLRAYLEIERMRFGDRLKVEESIAPDLDGVMIPSLILQPLVENAVLHGVSTLPEGGTVRIAARRDGDGLVLEIADDGPGFDPSRAPSGTGFGLHSARERLRAAGLDNALTLDTAPGRGTRIRITLPLNLGHSHSKGASS